MRAIYLLGAISSLVLSTRTVAAKNFTSKSVDPLLSAFDDRPAECPPCFNCQLDAFQCHQFANCNKFTGKCSCPPGYGGDDCSTPTCGSLADGLNRGPRQDKYCDCKDGWEGINCNVCKTDDACNSMMPEGEGGVCYTQGLAVKENHQMCDVTNRKILDQLKERKPQVTFSCKEEDEGDKNCNFQFWVDQVESFYCALDNCDWSMEADYDRNTTNYKCQNVKCQCIPDRMLCGENGSIDISDFLTEEIKGPATFSTVSSGGGKNDGSTFKEPAMDDLIKSIFGDESITLQCRSGECLYRTDVPGYQRPVKQINTPLIAGVIAGCSLFVVAVILAIWYLSRRAAYRGYGALRLDESDDEPDKLLTDQRAAGRCCEQ